MWDVSLESVPDADAHATATAHIGDDNLNEQRRRKQQQQEDASSHPYHQLDPSGRGFYDRLYRYLLLISGDETTERSSRVGSVEVVPAGAPIAPEVILGDKAGYYNLNSTSTNLTNIVTDRELALLPVTTILRFSYASSYIVDENDGTTKVRTLDTYGSSIYKGLAGFLLGMHHFNNGDGRVVAKLDGINETCNIRLVASDVFDTEFDQVTTLEILTRLLMGDEDDGDGAKMRRRKRRPVSVLYGASASANTVPLSILTSIYKIPQFSPSATSTDLDDKHRYSFFGRLVPSDSGTALAAVAYFRQRLRARHVGVLHVSDVYGTSYYEAISELSRTLRDPPLVTRGYAFSPTIDAGMRSEIRHELTKMKRTGYKVFFGVLFDKHYDLVVEEAAKLGLVGEGYSWIFADGLNEFRFEKKRLKKGSPLAVGTQGIGILKQVGGLPSMGPNATNAPPGQGTDDGGYMRFLDAWWSQGPDAVSYYNSMNPKNNSLDNADELYYRAPGPHAFRYPHGELKQPSTWAEFGYDTAVALGLAACAALEHTEGERTNAAEGVNNGTESQRHRYFDGGLLFDHVLKSDFEGATGQIRLLPGTYSRDPSTASFVIHNAYAVEEDGDEVIFDIRPALYTSRLAAVTSGGRSSHDVSSISWLGVEGTPFLHSDNTTNPPDATPMVENERLNRIGVLRPVGLTLSLLVILLSTSFFIWSHRHENVRVVRASQPLFLKMICVGTLIMGFSIVPMSIDDAVATEGLDAACMAWPWLFTVGFTITFSALFSKIWRVNKIFHNPNFRRIKVTERDVLIPFGILLSLNVFFLLIWTVVDPLRWTRVYIGETDAYGREWNSIGYCSIGEGTVARAMALLVFLINVIALFLANVQAYHARNIELEYSESRFVAIAMASVLQACLLGLPIMFLVDDNPPASFFVRSVLVFVICVATLLLIFVPKVAHYRSYKRKQRAERLRLQENGSGGNSVSILWDSARAKAVTSLISGRKQPRPSLAEFVNESSGMLGLKVLSHPKVDSDEVVSLKSQLDQYKCVTETLAHSLEERGVDMQSIVETVCTSLGPDHYGDGRDVVEGIRRTSAYNCKRVTFLLDGKTDLARDRELTVTENSIVSANSSQDSNDDEEDGTARPLEATATKDIVACSAVPMENDCNGDRGQQRQEIDVPKGVHPPQHIHDHCDKQMFITSVNASTNILSEVNTRNTPSASENAKNDNFPQKGFPEDMMDGLSQHRFSLTERQQAEEKDKQIVPDQTASSSDIAGVP